MGPAPAAFAPVVQSAPSAEATPAEATPGAPARPGGAPPPARRVGPAVAALALGGFAIGTTEFVTMGLLPDIARGVGVDIPGGGHLISAYALGVVVGAPVIAALGARLPRRLLAVALLAALLLGNALTALAPGYVTVLTARPRRSGTTSAAAISDATPK